MCFSEYFLSTSLRLFCTSVVVFFPLRALHLRIVLPRLFHNLSNSSVVFTPVFVVQPTSLRIGWWGGIWIAQQRLNTGQYSRYVINGRPLVLQDIQTDLTIVVDVRMEHFCQKSNLWRLVRIIFRKLEHQFEGSTLPWRVVGSKDNSLPHHNVGIHGGACHSWRWVILKAGM